LPKLIWFSKRSGLFFQSEEAVRVHQLEADCFVRAIFLHCRGNIGPVGFDQIGLKTTGRPSPELGLEKLSNGQG
jgi:hypothetical protein